MNQPKSNSKRLIWGLAYLLILILIVFTVSKIFTFFHQGAERKQILHTEIIQESNYRPLCSWMVGENDGRLMSEQTRAELQADYLKAWQVKNTAFFTNELAGIDDLFTQSARQNLYHLIEDHKRRGIHIETTSLSHRLELDLFSEDGQLVSMRDRGVVEHIQMYQDDRLIQSTTDTSDYRIILLLEDGFWRIRHMIRMESSLRTKERKTLNLPYAIKGINYYPQKNPWNTFGRNFDENQIKTDLRIIKELGLNSIRIFCQYRDFGQANLYPFKVERLQKLLDLAQEAELGVVITIFDFYGDYSVRDWNLNQLHLTGIVNACMNHPALLAWDVKNEPDLDFDSRGKERVMNWLSMMIQLIKSTDRNHPITIGWSTTQAAENLTEEVDFVSFHYYQKLDQFSAAVEALKAECPNKQLVLQEYGLSSYGGIWNLFSSSAEAQADYYREVQKKIKDHNLQYMLWTLYDFEMIPVEVVGKAPWKKAKQQGFGLMDLEGKQKPAYQEIEQAAN